MAVISFIFTPPEPKPDSTPLRLHRETGQRSFERFEAPGVASLPRTVELLSQPGWCAMEEDDDDEAGMHIGRARRARWTLERCWRGRGRSC